MKRAVSVSLAALILATLSGAAYAANIHGHQTSSAVKVSRSGSTGRRVSYDNTATAKEALQTLMLNAVDNYTTLQGSYSEDFKPIKVSYTVNFALEFSPSVGGYADVNNQGRITVYKQDGANAQMIEPGGGKRNFKVPAVNVAEQRKTLHSVSSRYGSFNGKPLFVYRAAPTLAVPTDDVTFPQEFALGYLQHLSDWNILGTTQYLGRNAVEISGQLPSYLAQKHDAVRFNALVDEQTGILLKEDEYDSNGNVTNEIVVTSLKFNQPVSASSFALSG
ncbi:MAG: hypothetical protein ACYCVB_10750 [Bacilli bacterium]